MKMNEWGGRFLFSPRGSSRSEGRQFGPKKCIKNWRDDNEGLKKRDAVSVYFSDESVFDKPQATDARGRPKGYRDGYLGLGLRRKAM